MENNCEPNADGTSARVNVPPTYEAERPGLATIFEAEKELMGYLYLAIAIAGEVAATAALKESAEFTKLVPSMIVIVGYATAFFFLALTLRTIPVGIAYAIWAGSGIALITIIGAVRFNEIPDLPAIIGLALIVTGVVVLETMSRMTAH